MDNKVKSVVATVSAVGFMSAAYYLPAETFMGIFAAGLFLIPVSFFVYMLQSVEKNAKNP